MALKFHPEPGTIVICDFKGFNAPEMVKKRPVVIISPRYKRQTGRCVIVPLSTTQPNPIENWHCFVNFDKPLGKHFAAIGAWAICNMPYAVSYERLDLIRNPRDQGQKRTYQTAQLTDGGLNKIRHGIVFALGLHKNLI